MIDVTVENFEAEVLQASTQIPVLVDFWAPWCGPCKSLGPVLEKLEADYGGRFKLVKINSDDEQQISQAFGIRSIPTCVLIKDGKPADGFMGALPEGQVTAFLERLLKGSLGGEEKDLLKTANDALAASDFAGAADLYAQVLAADNANVAALAGLARCYVGTGSIDQAKKTLALVPENKRHDATVAAAQAAIDLAEQAKSVGPVDDLQAKVAADPKDYQSRFDLAVALNAKGEREAAMDHLIEIVKRDRKWNDDGARKQLVQFFEAWGPADEATVSGRRRLSSILFS